MNFLDTILKYWPMVVVLFLGTASVVAGEYRVKTLEQAMQTQIEQSGKVHQMEINQAEIRTQLKAINRNIEQQNVLQQQMFNKLFMEK